MDSDKQGIKLVLFDFDDTLCLTESACFDLENTVAAKMGHGPMDREVHLRTWGRTLPRALPERFPGVDVPCFLEILRQHIPDYVASGRLDRVPEKNLRLLDTLKGEGYLLSVLTAREAFECPHLMRPDTPLGKRMDRFYTREGYFSEKPDPRVFETVLKDFDIQPHEAVYVGDSPGDAACAKGAGLFFVACLESGTRDAADFDGHAIDGRVSDLEHIARWLQDQGQGTVTSRSSE